MGDVIVSRRDRRRRAVSQRILVSTDLDRLRRCGHRVNGIILSCGSVWACPVCSARIRHAWLRDIMSTVEVAGQTVMLTCSLPADETDLLAPLLDMLLRSWSKVINGQPWKRAERRWHIGGFMRVVEATRSVRAWHVQIRVLMTLSARLDESERRASLHGWTPGGEKPLGRSDVSPCGSTRFGPQSHRSSCRRMGRPAGA